MATFQARYWFESNSRDKTGEQVIETVEADTAVEAAQLVQDRMGDPTFVVAPAFGPAQNGGRVVLHTALIRYVEIVPVGSGGVPVE